MQKIPTLFKRDYEGNRQVYNEPVEGTEWVLAGEGVATIKMDGTACLMKDGLLYRRYDAKKGRTPPDGFMPTEERPDPNTGHWPGWVPITGANEDKWHREALKNWQEEWDGLPPDGTYELVGPKIQGNLYDRSDHALIPHNSPALVVGPPRTFEGIREWLSRHDVEGIVWHHPDGRMVKIKRRDFGLPWGRK